MKPSYFPNTDFATPLQRFTKERLCALLDLLGTTGWLAAKSFCDGVVESFCRILDLAKFERVSRIDVLEVSMDWMGGPAQGPSKGVYARLRVLLEDWGLWTFERQPPRQGKNQRITKIFDINLAGLMDLARAVVIEMNRRAKEDPSIWDGWMPRHGFEWTGKLFRKLCGYDLFSPGEGFGETEEEVEALNEAEDDAKDDRWQAHEDRHTLRLEQVLENACEWYLWKFKEPIPDDSFLAPNDQDPRSRQIHWDTHRWNTFRQDLKSGLCSSWHDFELNGIERLVLG